MYAYPIDSVVTYAEDGTPQFDRAVDSSQLRELYSSLMTNGVLLKDSSNLQVSASTNMEIVVNPGLCHIQGCIKKFSEDTTITIASANATMSRIDTVVARLDLNSNYRDIGLFVIQGTPASVPTRPELTRNTSVYEIALADITVSANATTLSQANISDTRLDTNRCGIISAISQFDTTKLYEQIQADLKQFQESNEADFEQWFEHMKEQLGEDAAGNLQLQIDDHTEKSVSSENGVHGFRFFEGKLQAHVYDEESMTLKWVTVPGSGIDYDGDKSVKGAIDECVRTLGYTKSYNLLPCNKVAGSWNGMNYTPVLDEDGLLLYYSISGTRDAETYYEIYNGPLPKGLEVGKTYKVTTDCVGEDSRFYMLIYQTVNDVSEEAINTRPEYDGEGALWTIQENITNIVVRLCSVATSMTFNDTRFYPMIKPADVEDSTYKPYVEDVQTQIDNITDISGRYFFIGVFSKSNRGQVCLTWQLPPFINTSLYNVESSYLVYETDSGTTQATVYSCWIQDNCIVVSTTDTNAIGCLGRCYVSITKK